jgi:NhaP-type Na+/H+ or K+/H+ antiporter
LAVTAATSPGGEWEALVPRLLIAVPGGAVLGIIVSLLATRLIRAVAGTLSSIIAQFLFTFGTWILADRLGLSPIIAVVALAGMASQYAPARTSARDRLNTNAVWATVVFILNVLAFLLMGLQARVILSQLQGAALTQALVFALIVLGIVIGVRFAWVMLYGVAVRQFRAFFEKRVLHAKVPGARVGVLVSWCGMRGLVTLATALALPHEFPGRDVIVLSAFTVVLGTLILQGFTIRPLIALLRIGPDASLDEDISRARQAMLDAALEVLAGIPGEGAAAIRAEYWATRNASVDRSRPTTAYDELRTQAITAERRLLAQWRTEGRLQDDAFHLLEDELDRAELHVASFGTTWLDA